MNKANNTGEWVSVETPPETMVAVIVAGQHGSRLITCSDTAYYDKEKKKWFDHSNDLQLVDGFIKFYQLLPSPPNK